MNININLDYTEEQIAEITERIKAKISRRIEKELLSESQDIVDASVDKLRNETMSEGFWLHCRNSISAQLDVVVQDEIKERVFCYRDNKLVRDVIDNIEPQVLFELANNTEFKQQLYKAMCAAYREELDKLTNKKVFLSKLAKTIYKENEGEQHDNHTGEI